MPETQDPASFPEQVATKGTLTRTLVSLAVFAGYGVGTVKAHTTPVVKAIRERIAELAPESLLYACHAYQEGRTMGFKEESFRKAGRHAGKAARAAAAGVVA